MLLDIRPGLAGQTAFQRGPICGGEAIAVAQIRTADLIAPLFAGCRAMDDRGNPAFDRFTRRRRTRSAALYGVLVGVDALCACSRDNSKSRAVRACSLRQRLPIEAFV